MTQTEREDLPFDPALDPARTPMLIETAGVQRIVNLA